MSNSATNTASAGSIHQDGFGDFEYEFNYIGGNGASNPFTGPLTFTLSGTGVTLASFAELSTGGTAAFFALDIVSGQGNVGQTGVVDCCVGQPTPFELPPAETPIPGAVWLFAGGLGLLGMFYRKKEKPKSAWA